MTCIQGRVATLQALSGTGSLKIGAVFIQKFLPSTKVYLSNPTWGNHRYTPKCLRGPSHIRQYIQMWTSHKILSIVSPKLDPLICRWHTF